MYRKERIRLPLALYLNALTNRDEEQAPLPFSKPAAATNKEFSRLQRGAGGRP